MCYIHLVIIAEIHFYSSFQGYPTCHYWSPMARWPDGHKFNYKFDKFDYMPISFISTLFWGQFCLRDLCKTFDIIMKIWCQWYFPPGLWIAPPSSPSASSSSSSSSSSPSSSSGGKRGKDWCCKEFLPGRFPRANQEGQFNNRKQRGRCHFACRWLDIWVK